MPTKYIVTLGSLMSGLGKGVLTSSILKILDFNGYKVLPVKFDGYLNYDCGTMNPYRHGEVFVLDDKSEVDMDFGIYERFLNKSLSGDLSITGGKLFGKVTSKERNGDYLGEDIQIIPHLTNEIIKQVEGIAEKNKLDVLIIEVGGTVGDIENSYFIEAMRQLALRNEVVFINLTYIPKIEIVGEQKTKLAQLGFRAILQLGIRPNFIICRGTEPLLEKTKEKLALFSNLSKEKIIDDSDQKTMYNLPLYLMDQGFGKMLIKELGLKKKSLDKKKLEFWKASVDRIIEPKYDVNIAIVGKYTELKDSYASVKEALIHAGSINNAEVNISWIDAEKLEKEGPESLLSGMDGLLVPGAFGKRGIEGMIKAIQYARENKIPYLGLCLGMQLMAVEYARNVCSMGGANSTEFDNDTKYKIIDLMKSQRYIKQKGGTMRLGSWKCNVLDKDSIVSNSYGESVVYERHRHRYEFNNKYKSVLSRKGLKITGINPDSNLVEFIEWRNSFGIGTQAHPELKSRIEKPAPLFVSFVKAALGKDNIK